MQAARGLSVDAYGPWPRHGSAPEVAARSNDCGPGVRSQHRTRSPEERAAWERGVRSSWPGHTCRTEIDHDRRQQGNGARWKGSGVAASSAPKLLVSKTTTDAAAACTSDLLMVTTLPTSWLDHLPCVARQRMRCWVRGAPVSRLPKSSTSWQPHPRVRCRQRGRRPTLQVPHR